MTCSGEGLAYVKLKWLCFPSSRITEQNLIIMIRWKAAMEIHSHSHSSIPILLFPLSFPWHSHCHSHSRGNPMGSQLFQFPCTSLCSTSAVHKCMSWFISKWYISWIRQHSDSANIRQGQNLTGIVFHRWITLGHRAPSSSRMARFDRTQTTSY